MTLHYKVATIGATIWPPSVSKGCEVSKDRTTENQTFELAIHRFQDKFLPPHRMNYVHPYIVTNYFVHLSFIWLLCYVCYCVFLCLTACDTSIFWHVFSLGHVIYSCKEHSCSQTKKKLSFMTMCFVNDNVQNNYFHLMKTEYERLLNVPNEHNHKYFIIQKGKKMQPG